MSNNSFGMVFPPVQAASSIPAGTEQLIFWADQTLATENDTLSQKTTFDNIFVGSSLLTDSKLILPKSGAYKFVVQGWRCGQGSGELQVVGYRPSTDTVFYQRNKLSPSPDCGVFTSTFYWNNFQAGDEITFFANENITGTVGSNGTDVDQYVNPPTIDERGYVAAWFLQ
jgi:hypothetical protein